MREIKEGHKETMQEYSKRKTGRNKKGIRERTLTSMVAFSSYFVLRFEVLTSVLRLWSSGYDTV
jgi:hypothetical protein